MSHQESHQGLAHIKQHSWSADATLRTTRQAEWALQLTTAVSSRNMWKHARKCQTITAEHDPHLHIDSPQAKQTRSTANRQERGLSATLKHWHVFTNRHCAHQSQASKDALRASLQNHGSPLPQCDGADGQHIRASKAALHCPMPFCNTAVLHKVSASNPASTVALH